MTLDTSEKDFESTIEAHLLAHGYAKRDPASFDRALCLDSEEVLAFITATQPKTWEKLQKQHGAAAKDKLIKRLVKEIETRGTLDVLRKGIIDTGCKFELAYFRPDGQRVASGGWRVTSDG